MINVKLPNTNYVRVGLTGTRVGCARLFIYMFVGIGNANPSRWVLHLTRRPNANDFCVLVEYRLFKYHNRMIEYLAFQLIFPLLVGIKRRRNRYYINVIIFLGVETPNTKHCYENDLIAPVSPKSLIILFPNLTKLHCSPYYRGVKLWNELPVNIQRCSEKSEFRNRVKEYMFVRMTNGYLVE